MNLKFKEVEKAGRYYVSSFMNKSIFYAMQKLRKLT